jgi:flagellar hook-associated protein 1 FlgK
MALGDQAVAGAGRRTFLDEAIDITAEVGRTAAAAAGELELFNAEADHLAGLRDSESGVSLQEETMRLSQFQHASEAQVRFLSTIDNLLGTMIENL